MNSPHVMPAPRGCPMHQLAAVQAPLDPRVRGLEDLIATGVLKRAEDVAPPGPRGAGARPSPLPAAPCAVPRSWDECEDIMREPTGRPLEPGYLELVVPVFRVAHMAMDAGGTRLQQERPMNASALEAMRASWPQVLEVLRRIRAAYLERFPAARAGWTVGHVERLATVALALPTYLLMRAPDPVPVGRLHPALSCLFRVTDGLRMVMHQMQFVPIGEPARRPDAPVSAQEIHACAQRNYSLHPEHGVCAGPRATIAEFLSTILDGGGTGGDVELEPEVQAALEQLQPAIDYGLLGLKAHAALFSTWPIMTRAYEQLLEVAERASGRSAIAAALYVRLSERVERIRSAAFLSRADWRMDREHACADMYAQCHLGAHGALPRSTLQDRIAPREAFFHSDARQAVRGAIERCFGTDAPQCRDEMRKMTDIVMAYLLQAQQVLRVACEAQREVNAVLHRKPPQGKFLARDVDLHNRLRGQHDQRLPYLIDELEDIFGLEISVDADELSVGSVAR